MRSPIGSKGTLALLALCFSPVFATSCCERLEALYPSKVSLPLQLNYIAQNAPAYWASNSIKTPGCVYTATSPQDVSNAVKILHQYRCEYALRSGGHNPIPGWSNTQGGVLLSTKDINDVTYDAQTGTVKIGAGCKWSDVYSVLDPLGVATMGGRASSVGTGGFLLGGGISYYSNSQGWAANGVLKFDVVFANGTIGSITQASHPDLFTVMKGAGSNFAIVTHFTQIAFPQPRYNAGFVFYSELVIPKVLDALYNYSTVGIPSDTKSHIIPAITQAGPELVDVGAFGFFYPSALGLGEAEVFKPFTKQILYTATTKSDRNGLMSIANEIANFHPAGRRQIFADFSVVLDHPELLKEIYKAFNLATRIPRVLLVGYQCSLILYPITPSFLAPGTANGKKNIIGVEDSAAARAGKVVMIVCINITWNLGLQDDKAQEFVDDIIAKMKAAAQARGALHPYQYMNYAAGNQDVLAGYGAASVAKMLAVKAQVDPMNDFGTLVKGRYVIPGM